LRFLFALLLLMVLAAALGAAWLWYGITQPYQGFPAEGIFVDVPRGTSSRSVAHLLQNNGVIRSAAAFEIYARRESPRTLQAGEYFFARAASGRDVFWKLAKGDVFEQPFTVKEGDTMFDIAQELEKAKLVTREQFLAAARDPSLVRDIAPTAPTLEGFLFPATYQLSRHPIAAGLTADMVKKFKEEWAAIAAENPAPNSPTNIAAVDAAPSAPSVPLDIPATSAAKTDTQPTLAVVTLASLVERETPRPEERPLVAGVFTNRLQKGMALQCDPTVIYALEQVRKYHGTLTGKDLKFDSPYNTYEHTGLPPGPIGNPGEASLRAALQPAKTNYIYFVANTHGGHFFAATLAEHNRNVLKYRRLVEGGSAEEPPAKSVAHQVPHHASQQAAHRKGATP